MRDLDELRRPLLTLRLPEAPSLSLLRRRNRDDSRIHKHLSDAEMSAEELSFKQNVEKFLKQEGVVRVNRKYNIPPVDVKFIRARENLVLQYVDPVAVVEINLESELAKSIVASKDKDAWFYFVGSLAHEYAHESQSGHNKDFNEARVEISRRYGEAAIDMLLSKGA